MNRQSRIESDLYVTGNFCAQSTSLGAIEATSLTIGQHSLGSTEVEYLDGQDQPLQTTDSPTFAAVTVTGITTATGGISNGSKHIGKITTVTSTADIAVTDATVICNHATTAFTVTLPIAAVGQRFDIKNIGAATVTIAVQAGDVIDDVTTQAIEQWESITVQCYALTKWAIL